MRHTSAKITLDTYGHLLPDAPQQAALRLDESVLGTSGRDGTSA
jgi:hypothetical protein